MVEQRPAYLQQAGELQLRLELDTGGADDVHRLRSVDRVTKKRCLAYARLPTDQQRRAASPPRALERAVDVEAFQLAADEHGVTLTPRRRILDRRSHSSASKRLPPPSCFSGLVAHGRQNDSSRAARGAFLLAG